MPRNLLSPALLPTDSIFHASLPKCRFLKASRRLFCQLLTFAVLGGGAGCNLPPLPISTPTITGPVGSCTVPNAVPASLPNLGSRLISRNRLHSHVPASADSAKRDLGAYAPTETLDLTFSLPLNHVADLEALIAAQHNPASPQYGKYITPSEFTDRFGATTAQLAQVEQFAQAQGLLVTEVSANRRLIQLTGPHERIARAFATEVHRFEDADGKPFFAPKYEPTIPEGLPIEAVHGMHNLTRMRSHARRRDAIPRSGTLRDSAMNANADTGQGTSAPRTMGNGPAGGLTPQDLRAAYRFASAYDGRGQTLAVFELDGYNPSDVTRYENAYGLPHVPLFNIYVDGVTGYPGQGSGEVTLDLELMIAAAPGAARILVYQGPNTDRGVLDIYNRIAMDNTAPAVSTSWGAPETQSSPSFLQAENSIFMQMAAQGQTLYAASGDSGAYDNGRTVSVDDPASQPYVVAVGGTRILENGSGDYSGETTWNAGSPQLGGGGGGVSQYWSIPSYQSALASTATARAAGVSSTMRNLPDVSLEADPATGYSIFFQGQWVVFGGTSCASPIWAGFTALVNQARAEHGLGTLGLPHPALYALASQPSSYAADFNDIADGSTNLHYPAVPGFDNATGLGTLRADGLLADLAQVARPPVTPSTPETGTVACTP